MALLRNKHPQSVPGEFFVDTTCIDCDLCRQIAPKTFGDTGDQSVVWSQPQTATDTFDALKALVTCPTASIGTVHHQNVKPAVEAYPDRIDANVYFCGFASEQSYGASSYLITSGDGNVLIDSPRFAKPLVKKIEAMGGVSRMLLTHRDDVADHDQWAAHFGAERVMHINDAGRLQGKIERLITGDQQTVIQPNLILIPTPGHTRGHVVYLYNNRYLFTGDHMWWSDHYRSLHASRNVCWYSWPEQTRSMEKLQAYRFEWVLPGHGRRFNAPPQEMKQQLAQCLDRMRKIA